MLSLSKMQEAAQAVSYYKKENYYQENSAAGKFSGSLAEHFNLKNEAVTKENFEQLLNAMNKKRAGFDATFSAPKSVSILLEKFKANQDSEAENILNAHNKAVEKAMQEVEKRAQTRIKEDTIIKRINDVKIIYASFQHDTARANADDTIDMQLHTHNFIFNKVEYYDYRTKSRRLAALENKEIFKNKLFLGQIYRSELAKNLKKLNYEIEVTDTKNGFFEIKGFSQEQLDEFSSRSKAMRELLDSYREKYNNKSDAELLNLINEQNKRSKKKVDREALYAENDERMQNVDITIDFVKGLKSVKNAENINIEEVAKSAIETAAENISETKSVFTKKEILQEALKIGLSSGLTYDVCNKIIDSDITSLKSLKQMSADKYTTKSVLEAESYVIENMRATHNAFSNKDNIKNYITDTMTNAQKQMIETVLTTKSQFLAIQGDAGTGKTFAMKAINDFMRENREYIEVVGLSFTAKAASGLEADSNIKSTTIHSYLNSEKKKKHSDLITKRLIVIDEAGLAGSKQIAEVMRIAKKNNDKVVFVGDTKQFSSIAAGDIFADMQKNGIETVKMSETLRQKTEFTKEVVKLTKEKDFETLYDVLESENTVVETNNFSQIVDEYMQNDSLIIASKNEDRQKINEMIRAKMQLKDEQEFSTLSNVSMSATQKLFARNYENKKITAYKVKNIANGEVVEVLRKKDEHTIIVKNAKNQEVEIDLKAHSKNIQIYKEQKKKFAINDKIIFTKNSKKFKNGEIAKIKDIKNNIITLEDDRTFDISKNNYIDYAYAITDYKSQGVTADNVVVVANSQMTNINAFYTQVTRAKYNLKIYTDDKVNFYKNIQRESSNDSTIKQAKDRELDNFARI